MDDDAIRQDAENREEKQGKGDEGQDREPQISERDLGD